MTSKMTEPEILAVIQSIARRQIDWRGELKPSMHLIKDLRLDSLKVLALANEVELHFGIEIDAQHEQPIETIGHLIDAIRRKLQ